MEDRTKVQTNYFRQWCIRCRDLTSHHEEVKSIDGQIGITRTVACLSCHTTVSRTNLRGNQS